MKTGLNRVVEINPMGFGVFRNHYISITASKLANNIIIYPSFVTEPQCIEGTNSKKLTYNEKIIIITLH